MEFAVYITLGVLVANYLGNKLGWAWDLGRVVLSVTLVAWWPYVLVVYLIHSYAKKKTN